MIIQGTNTPIDIYLDDTPADISVTLRNEIEVLKHWTINDLNNLGDNHFKAPITQLESREWEPGRCFIEIKWNTSSSDEESAQPGIVQFARSQDVILPWMDTTQMNDTVDNPIIPEPEESQGGEV